MDHTRNELLLEIPWLYLKSGLVPTPPALRFLDFARNDKDVWGRNDNKRAGKVPMGKGGMTRQETGLFCKMPNELSGNLAEIPKNCDNSGK